MACGITAYIIVRLYHIWFGFMYRGKRKGELNGFKVLMNTVNNIRKGNNCREDALFLLRLNMMITVKKQSLTHGASFLSGAKTETSPSKRKCRRKCLCLGADISA